MTLDNISEKVLKTVGREYHCRQVRNSRAGEFPLNAICWEQAETVEFHDFWGERIKIKTEAKLLWDTECLLARISCHEPRMDQLRATPDGPSPIWEEDSIEVFLDVQGKGESYVQVIVNASGRVWGSGDFRVEGWRSQMKVEVERADDRWTAHLALPFPVLGVSEVESGDHWRINLVRNRPARAPGNDAMTFACSPPFSNTPHRPKRFGVLVFADAEGKLPEDRRRPATPMTIGFRSKTPDVQALPSIISKADEIESLLAGPFWEDPPGWLMTHVVLPERRPMVESDFEGQWIEPPNFKELGLPDVHIYYRNEDTMMCTGAFLGGLARRLAVRTDAATRDLANRCVRGLYHVYELGREIERGFTPKPYGGKCSKQFSPDNFDNYYIGLGQYYPLADDHRRALIEEILCEAANYWIRHKHACPFPYFHYGMWDNEHDPDPSGHWPLLWMPLYRLAYNLSKDPKFEREYHRLADQFLRLGRSDAETLKAGSYHRWLPQLSALMEWSPEDRPRWLKAIEQWRRLIFEQESVTVCRGHIRCGEVCARHLGDKDLGAFLAREIAGLTEEKMIYANQHGIDFFNPTRAKNDPTRQIYWRLLDGDFMAETYFAIWDGRMAGIWT